MCSCEARADSASRPLSLSRYFLGSNSTDSGLGRRLPPRHLLCQVEQEPPLGFLHAAEKPAELVQNARVFAGTPPDDFLGRLPLRKPVAEEHGRIIPTYLQEENGRGASLWGRR